MKKLNRRVLLFLPNEVLNVSLLVSVPDIYDIDPPSDLDIQLRIRKRFFHA